MFHSSDMTKTEIATMLGKKPEQVSRWLGGPGNMTLDTLSDLIFAIKGNFIKIEDIDEFGRRRKNSQHPEVVEYATGSDPAFGVEHGEASLQITQQAGADVSNTPSGVAAYVE